MWDMSSDVKLPLITPQFLLYNVLEECKFGIHEPQLLYYNCVLRVWQHYFSCASEVAISVHSHHSYHILWLWIAVDHDTMENHPL